MLIGYLPLIEPFTLFINFIAVVIKKYKGKEKKRSKILSRQSNLLSDTS